MIDIKSCPTCGSRLVRTVRQDVKLTVRGRRHVIPDVCFVRCDACGEELFDIEASRQIDAHLNAVTRRTHRRKTA